MSPAEMALHAQKRIRQAADARRQHDWSGIKLEAAAPAPKLPVPSTAPAILRETLQHDVEEILAGRWRAFGHLQLAVDDPPLWQKDYLAGIDLTTHQSAFNLNHRSLPGGSDVKLIWEMSRWHALVRLAMAGYLLNHERAAEKCVVWLEDWVKHNAPFRGWNWTSALESGMRLVQFTWIDALLSTDAERWGFDAELETLRYSILPSHAWYTWRHKSFGSSANNHLLGELTGLVLATVRWPALAQWGASLDELQVRWEREVLAQFAGDGGNKEQALSYHLFSFELALHARNALKEARREISPAVESRLDSAIRFFWDVQADHEPWDYGDSDDARVVPVFLRDDTAVQEWRQWMAGRKSPAVEYWLGNSPSVGRPINSGPPLRATEVGAWWSYAETGIAVCESGLWWLRWDLSPLGYLSTAAHGHLDALHLSIWFKGVPFIIDPGTGAYYWDTRLRQWLTSRSAHNAPCPSGPEWPAHRGPFLWSEQHAKPVLEGTDTPIARLQIDRGVLSRRITPAHAASGFYVDDEFRQGNGSAGEFSVRWQFAPGTWIKRTGEHSFILNRKETAITLEAGPDWDEVTLVEKRTPNAPTPQAPGLEAEFAGTVSPAFRKLEWAPYLKLTARPKGGQPCLFRTTFVASAAA